MRAAWLAGVALAGLGACRSAEPAQPSDAGLSGPQPDAAREAAIVAMFEAALGREEERLRRRANPPAPCLMRREPLLDRPLGEVRPRLATIDAPGGKRLDPEPWEAPAFDLTGAQPARTKEWFVERATAERRDLGYLVFGPRPQVLFVRDGGDRSMPEIRALDVPTTLILATIHGDEYAGTPLVQMLATVLDEDHALTTDRRVILVPVANPDGLAANTRGNANGVDLNRNFDAANWGSSKRAKGGTEPLSEIESNFLADLFERYQPDRVVSLHQPLGLVDYDGPGEAYARAVAAAGGLPVQKLGSRPGSFGSFVGVDHNIPILTVELPKGAQLWSDAALWERFGPLLLAAVTWTPGAAD